MATLNKVFDFIVTAMAILAAVILVGMMLATVYKVGLRLFLGHGIIGIDQLSGTAMVYMTLFGGAWVLRNNAHITIDFFVGDTSKKSTRTLVVINSLIGAAICFTLAYFGTIAVWSSLQRGIMVAAELEIPRAVGLTPIPFGFLLIAIEFLRRAVRAHRGETEVSDERLEA